MNLTERGKRVAAVLLLLLGAGALFVDPLLLAAAASVSVFVAYDLLDVYLAPRRPGSFALAPSSFEARALRGNSRSFQSVIRASRAVDLDLAPTSWFRAERASYPPGTWPFRFTLTFDLAGAYSLDGIPARARSRYGLFSTRAVVPVEVKGRAYPRLIAAALAALEYLTRVGAGSEGEVEKDTLGVGLEYAETREYLPGDSLRRVDWKATARSGMSSLMIKKYYSEGGGAVHIIYFVETPGRATHDELATQLLDLVVSSAARITPVSVTAYEGGSRLATLEGKGWEVVINTLNLVMAEARITYDDLYSMLDVSSLSAERRELIAAGRGRLAELLRKAGGKRRALVADLREVVGRLASPDVQSSFIILSSLVSNRDVVAELIEDLRVRRAETTVVYPPRPWKDASSLEEAYTLQATHEKMLAFVERSGCLVGPIPLKLPRVRGIPSWAVSAAA
jgi:uncharacterized protein (DUF58 family)